MSAMNSFYNCIFLNSDGNWSLKGAEISFSLLLWDWDQLTHVVFLSVVKYSTFDLHSQCGGCYLGQIWRALSVNGSSLRLWLNPSPNPCYMAGLPAKGITRAG